MASKSPPFLRIVRPEEIRPLAAEDFAPQTWQSNLFASTDPSQIIFVNVALLDERDFLTVLIASKMRFVIDLRQAPRFDIGSLNRRLVFTLFERSSAKYFDVAGRLEINDSRDSRLNPAVLASYLREHLSAGDRLDGPLIFFVDAAQFSDEYMFALAEALPAGDGRGWAPLRIPFAHTSHAVIAKASGPELARRLIFISHANPEDNEFTRWLATQLSSEGFLVWSDITDLIGGEELWERIEDAIRVHARKVIVVLSRAAQTKKGVLDEINCAVMAERSLALDGYVLPIRVDDLPFSEIRANLARKNVIDFHGNWAEGLRQLLKVLTRDEVPRDVGGTARTANWYDEILARAPKRQKTEEKLISNWFEILQFPDHVRLHSPSVTPSIFEQAARASKIPRFGYFRLIGSFAEAHEFQPELPPQIVMEESYRIGFTDFLKGRPLEMPGMSSLETHKMAMSLVRQAWNATAAKRGLLPFETASGALAWYVPKGLIPMDKVSFHDSEGRPRRKTLVGQSAKRGVYWHYAIEMKPSLGSPPRLIARSHVIFTLDGRLPLDSKAKMHSLRRSFCRNWWNDRWRDLLLAFGSWIAEDRESFTLASSAVNPIIVSARPILMISPISLVEGDAQSGTPVSEEDEVEWDDPDIESDELFGEENAESASDDDGPQE
ncbi:MAG: toll/interleukin-1 receptor domain-containing protein [Alphaproteobacteria bacterium]|uniref:toll/interleukin-1 receptor domain-containing protein n=1 Tax=Bradyrhizobium sp. TaxID=376 RepID=UPI001EC9AB71|nr:toll/interleukin-1 receptor domain-containing protein [Bradyrhizobium sp.]MBV9570772.1 toll/interleukin-1 receptor domain-containing protein [Alphaproteobacteria bacterium]MBV9979024.1 toll/interleukin-1 receptor domain-containing protein [Bradyrhizobium sp.]